MTFMHHMICLVVALVGFIDNEPEPVCHSVTEDSVITDCDYRDGGWYSN